MCLTSCVTLSTPLATRNLNVLALEMGTRPVSLGYGGGAGFMQPSGQSVCQRPGFSPHPPLTGQVTLGVPHAPWPSVSTPAKGGDNSSFLCTLGR